MLMANSAPVRQKDFFLTCLGVVVFILVSDFVLHGVVLKAAYLSTAELWRPPAEMNRLMPWMLLGQVLGAFFLTLLFVRGYTGRGWKEGLRFGLLVAPFGIAHNLIQFATSPIPGDIFTLWMLGGSLQYLGASLLAGGIYGRHDKG